jgi:parallel beta-helix repeat protein
MRTAHSRRRLVLGFLLLKTVPPLQPSALIVGSQLRNTSSLLPGFLLGRFQMETRRGRIIVADEQPGDELGTKIVAADRALGSEPGEIQVMQSGEISEPIVLSQNHNLVCVGSQARMMMSTPTAMIAQQSNTYVQGCTLSSSQIVPPVDGAEIVSRGSRNVQVEGVTFIGGGFHIEYERVSNFRIENTRHVSINASGTSPIFIDSSTHGQIISPRIEGYIAPVSASGIRLIGITRSSFIEVKDPDIHDVDASTVPGCGAVSFTASNHSSLEGGMISGLKNCDAVLTESTEMDASSDIDITGTAAVGQNPSPGAGKNANNGEGFDIFNSRRVRLSKVIARSNGKSPSNPQSGIEISNSNEVTISNCISSDNGFEGIRVDGSSAVTITNSRTNHNGSAGILVMPALGRVSLNHGSSTANWAPGDANMTFSAVWPVHTKIVIGGSIYTIALIQSTGQLTLTADVSAATGVYGYNVDSYVEINEGESLDNGQLSAAMPVNQNVGQREGAYFAGGFSGEITGRVTGLHASDTQSRKTQTFGIRIENQARIVANGNTVKGNLAGGIQDSPAKSTIQ